MTAWIVVLCLVLVLTLLGCIRLGAELSVSERNVSFSACVGCFTVRLGRKKKEEKSPASTETEETMSQESKKKNRGLPPFPVLKILARNGYNILCRIVSRLRVDYLKIHFTAAWADPAVTAMAYSAAGVAMEGLLRLGGRRLARSDLLATVDFDSGEPKLDFCLRLSLRVYQIIGAALGFGFGFLRDYLRMKKGKDE